MPPHPIIALAPNSWFGVWMNRQQILTRLAERGWPILYSSGPLSFWERHSDNWKRSPRFSHFVSDHGVEIDIPGRYLPERRQIYLWQKFVIARHADRFRKFFRPAEASITHAFHPSFCELAISLNSKYLIYHVYDAFTQTPGWSSEDQRRHSYLVERADLLVTCSEAMARGLPGDGPSKARILPNGVDFEFFNSSATTACPGDLAEIPYPRIGYTGSLNIKVDFPMVAFVANERPDWHWVFVGRTSKINSESGDDGDQLLRDAFRLCQSLPNVHFLGVKDFTKVPTYERHMDVNVMCYRTKGGWWESGYPLKLHEYLAIGKPVVSASLETVEPFSHVIDIARSPDEWVSAIERALNHGGIGTTQERIAVAKKNTWDTRVDQLEEWLFEMIDS